MVSMMRILLILLSLFGYSFSSPAQPASTTSKASNDLLRLLSFVNETEDKCKSYNGYACGEVYKRPFSINGTSKYSSIKEDFAGNLISNLLKLVEKGATSKKSIDNLFIDHWKSCVDSKRLDEIGLCKFRNDMRKAAGGKAFLGQSVSEDFSWHDFYWKSVKMGYIPNNQFFSITVDRHPTESRSKALRITQPTIKPPRSAPIYTATLRRGEDDSGVQNYLRYLKKAGKMIGITNVESAMPEVLDLTIQLARLTKIGQEANDIPNRFQVKTLHEFDQMNVTGFPKMTDFIPKLFTAAGAGDVDIDENEAIVIEDQDYIEKVGELLNKTGPRVVKNFVVMATLLANMFQLTTEARSLRKDYLCRFAGSCETFPLKTDCIMKLYDRHYGIDLLQVLSHMTLKNDPPPNLEKLNTVASYITSRAIRAVDDLWYMDIETQTLAKEKLRATTHILKPFPQFRNETLLKNYFKGLVISPGKFHQNQLNIAKFRTRNNFGGIRTKTDMANDWTNIEYSRSMAVLDNGYIPKYNSILMNVGSLKGDIYSEEAPYWQLFGTVGIEFAEYLFNAIDESGAFFDKDGLIANWWSKSTKTNFKKVSNCISNQYKQFLGDIKQFNVDTAKLDFSRLKRELIAQNFATQVALDAYDDYACDNEDENTISGKPYSAIDLFYISMARAVCMRYDDDLLQNVIVGKSKYIVSNFTINGPLSNIDDFKKRYSCKNTDEMVVKRASCNLWEE